MTPRTFQAGMLSAPDAAYLTEMARRLAGQTDIAFLPPLMASRQGFNGQPVAYLDKPIGPDYFFAELTSGSSPYSWKERVETAAGTWADGSRTGTTNGYQATPSSGTSPVPASGDLVLMRASPSVSGAYEFASVRGSVSGLPVSGEAVLYGALALTTPITTGSSATVILEATIPSSGAYLVGYTLTTALEGDAGTHVESLFTVKNGGGVFYSDRGCASSVLQVTGKTASTVHSTFPLGLTGGDVLQIRAAWNKQPFTADPTYAAAMGIRGTGVPVLATVTSLTAFDTRIFYAKLSADPGGYTPSPPPPYYGSIGGNVQSSGGSNLPGRTLTLSGVGSGTTTTDARGNYAFTGLADGSDTVTLTLLAGETSTTSVDGAAASAGAAGTVTIASGDSHNINFVVTPGSTTGTLVVTVTVGGSPAAGASLTYSGGGSFVESPTGTYTMTGVTAGTGGSVSYTFPYFGFGTCNWTVSDPITSGSTAGSPTVATPVTITGGGTTTVTFAR